MSSTTERTILTSFLLSHSPLPSILSLQQFTSLFPRAAQSSPQIKVLYRDIQHQRSRSTDKVTQSIEQECKRGIVLKREVIRARRQAERDGGLGDVDEEGMVEDVMYNGQTSSLPITKMHTLRSILPEMEKAVEDMEEEIRRDEEEAERLLEEMQNIVGALSDLRYGRLANAKLPEQVMEGLERLERACGEQDA